MATLAEQLIDTLDGDLAQRRRELIDLRLLLAQASGSRADMLGRTDQVMAYAHWEGFVKFALSNYLEYIQGLGLGIANLRYELQALALRRALRTAVEPERDVSQIASMLSGFDVVRSQAFSVDSSLVVKSGNLTADTLKILLTCVGLDYSAPYQARENFINSIVCGRRHRVAHGGWQPVTPREARDLIHDVINLCEEVNLQVQDAVIYEGYLLPHAESAPS